MRLSGPVPAADNPASWVEAHRRAGYSAAAWPPCSAEDPRLPDFLDAARKADLIIAEVGAWSNPISSNEKERAEAFDKCCRSLDAADRIGTRCCVNIAGSRDAVWDGPHPENLSDETFDMIVQCVRKHHRHRKAPPNVLRPGDHALDFPGFARQLSGIDPRDRSQAVRGSSGPGEHAQLPAASAALAARAACT